MQNSNGETPRIFVVVPAYNEDAVLRQTLTPLVAHGYEVVIVDDGSRVPAERWLRGMPVHYLRHQTNLGQGAALETGTKYAVLRGGDVVIHFDADGQHPVEQIPVLIQPILRGECDVVLGSRFLNRSDRDKVPPIKRIALKVGAFVSWLTAGVWLSDTHNGFRALSRNAAEQISLTENGFAHATEILEQIRTRGLRYRELPATIRYTEYSLAKGQSVWNGINIALDLLLRKLFR